MGTAVFGAPEFKARSGRMVRANEDGSVSFHLGNGYIGADHVFDAEEFFQAKRDAELGRWRWPANPDYVVYRRGDGAVLVLCERNAEGGILYRRDDPVHDMEAEAARAYFEAHPERKPWQDAKPGELWVLDIEGTEYAAVREYGVDFKLSHTNLISPRDERIEAGSRIWPEDAS